MKHIQYCRRDLIRCGHYGLCLSDKAFRNELKRLRVPREQWGVFVKDGKSAQVHFFQNDTERTTLVCLQGYEKRSPVEVYGLLIHEAVHIWQTECEYMHEDTPGDEIEAYAIQSVSQNLIDAYLTLTKRK